MIVRIDGLPKAQANPVGLSQYRYDMQVRCKLRIESLSNNNYYWADSYMTLSSLELLQTP